MYREGKYIHNHIHQTQPHNPIYKHVIITSLRIQIQSYLHAMKETSFVGYKIGREKGMTKWCAARIKPKMIHKMIHI